MKFLVQKIDNKLTLDFCHEIMLSQIYAKWRGDSYQIKYVEKYIPKDLKHPENYIPIGTVEFVSDYINTYFPDRVDCLIPLNVPDALKSFAGRVVMNIDCEEAIPYELKSTCSSTLGQEKEFKNLTDDGPVQLYRKSLYKIKDETNGLIDYDASNPEDRKKLIGYQVSTKINNIRSEWRVFVHHNEVKQVCYYDGDPLVFPDSHRIQHMVERYASEDAPVAYTLDVCVTDYSTHVMEVHRFFSCGLYGFADYRILPYMFSQAWHEMMHIRSMDKEKEFHNSRTAFYIDNEEIIYIPDGYGHSDYFEEIGHPEYIDTKVRGYIKDDLVMCYIGKDFSLPCIDDRVFIYKSIMPMLQKEKGVSKLGLGCEKGEIGEQWIPLVHLRFNDWEYITNL